MTTTAVNVAKLEDAIVKGTAAAFAFVNANPEGKNWYPCGFAWLAYKCRKNAREAAVLKAHGFSWDDYEKCYSLWAGKFHNTQSMDYKESILRAMNEVIAAEGFTMRVRTRID